MQAGVGYVEDRLKGRENVMRLKNFAVAAATVLALTPSVWAHHSSGGYIMTEYTYLEGVITEVHWFNPHVWLYMEAVDDNGDSAVWVLEATGLINLRNNGVTEDTVTPGTNVSVRCHRLRDGANGCLLGFLTPEGREELEWG
jgi:hypothetical protein